MPFNAGQKVTAGALNALERVTYVDKFIDQNFTATTTYADIDDLSLAVAADSTYLVTLFLIHHSASNTPDLKVRFVNPAGSSWIQQAEGQLVGVTGAYPHAVDMPAGVESSATDIIAGTLSLNTMMRVTGRLVTAATAGTCKVQGAQNTSSGTPTTVRAGSWLRLEKVA